MTLTSFPGSPTFFNVHEGKRGSPGIQHHWHDIMKKRWSTTVNFKSVLQLQFIKHSCLRPSRILQHLFEGFGTISSIHIELERSFAPTQFPWSATLPPFIYGAYVTHMTLDPRHPLSLSLSLSCTLKKIREPGDEASLILLYMFQ